MAVIKTSELFDRFFETKNPEVAKKTRAQIDRPEVYEYEEKIGKQLVDMNTDELFDMIETFGDQRSSEDHQVENRWVNYSSYGQIASSYRSLFNFYIDNYEIIRNPWNDKRMKGVNAMDRLSQKNKPFTKDDVNKAIQLIHKTYNEDKAKYLECIILLYYSGFSKAEEIVTLTEDMINFRTKEVRLPGRTIVLSDRCFELLMYVHSMAEMEGARGNFLMKQYKNYYFKYAIRYKEEDSFNDRTQEEVGMSINRKILIDVKRKFSIEINYRMLYLLGFYDYLTSVYGSERTKEILSSVRNPKDTDDLMVSAKRYGVVIDNVSHLKRMMRPFI